MLLADVQKAAELAAKYEKAKDELEKFLILRPQFAALWVGVKLEGQRDNPLTYSIPDAARNLVLDRVETALNNRVVNLKSQLLNIGVVLS